MQKDICKGDLVVMSALAEEFMRHFLIEDSSSVWLVLSSDEKTVTLLGDGNVETMYRDDVEAL